MGKSNYTMTFLMKLNYKINILQNKKNVLKLPSLRFRNRLNDRETAPENIEICFPLLSLKQEYYRQDERKIDSKIKPMTSAALRETKGFQLSPDAHLILKKHPFCPPRISLLTLSFSIFFRGGSLLSPSLIALSFLSALSLSAAPQCRPCCANLGF